MRYIYIYISFHRCPKLFANEEIDWRRCPYLWKSHATDTKFCFEDDSNKTTEQTLSVRIRHFIAEYRRLQNVNILALEKSWPWLAISRQMEMQFPSNFTCLTVYIYISMVCTFNAPRKSETEKWIWVNRQSSSLLCLRFFRSSPLP